MKKHLLLAAALFLFISQALSQANPKRPLVMDKNGYEQIMLDTLHKVSISGSYIDLVNLPGMNLGVARPINSTTFTISSTRPSIGFYTITISCTATIGSASTGSVTLQYFNTGNSTWTTLGFVANSNQVTLAIVLNSVNTQTLVLSEPIPPGALCRLVSASSGTTTITYNFGNEFYF